jgi:hypothetical protein
MKKPHRLSKQQRGWNGSLATEDGTKAMEEALDAAIAVRLNMARLEAQGVRTEISTGNQPAKAKPKKRLR